MWGRRAAPAVSYPSDDNDGAHGVRAPYWTRGLVVDVGPARRAGGLVPSDGNDGAHGVRAPHIRAPE